MKTRAKCDACGQMTVAWSEWRFPAEEFFAIFDEVKKETEGGNVVFYFCPACVFELPSHEANGERLTALVRRTVTGNYHAHVIN